MRADPSIGSDAMRADPSIGSDASRTDPVYAQIYLDCYINLCMKTLLLILLLLPITIVHAQKKKRNDIRFFVFDENWKRCDFEKATYLSTLEKLNDTAYQMKYYNFAGPLLSIETFKDKDATILNGALMYYGADGKIDSTGYTINGRRNDWWYYYTESSTVWQKEKYGNGKLLKRMDAAVIVEEWALNREKLAIALVSDDEMETSFDGGERAWNKYIDKTIEFPDRAKSFKKEGSVIVEFTVSEDGAVENAFIIQSLEYSIDEEALRIIRNSPKWKPARQGGQYVKVSRRQVFTFKLP